MPLESKGKRIHYVTNNNQAQQKAMETVSSSGWLIT